MSKAPRINPEWPQDVKDAFGSNPASTMAVITAPDGSQTAYTTPEYEQPADGVEHLTPIRGIDEF